MGYRIRVLGLKNVPVPVEDLRPCLPSRQEIVVEEGSQADWTQIVLRHLEGTEIALIEKNPVIPGELGHDELEEFIEEIQGDQPTSGAEWLRNYLPKVRGIYALQLLDGTDVNGRLDWSAFGAESSMGSLWRNITGRSRRVHQR